MADEDDMNPGPDDDDDDDGDDDDDESGIPSDANSLLAATYP